MKKRADGRWCKQICIGGTELGKLDNNGEPIVKRKIKYVYGKTKKEVEEKAYTLLLQVGKGINISLADDSFKMWADRFLEYKKTENLSNSHILNLENFSRHLRPIHALPINKVEIQHLRNIIVNLSTEVIGSDGSVMQKPLSKRTLNGIRQCAKQVFNMAVESRAIDYNPALFIKVPKETIQEQRKAISEQQQRWVVEFEHRCKTAAMIMLFAGLRRGEVGALTWGDINFQEGFISVNKAVEFINGQPKVKSTKTKSGDRTVDIPQILVNYLQLEKNKSNCMYVIHNKDGKMLSKSTWRQIWNSYMKDLNVVYGYTENQKTLMGINSETTIRKNIPGGLKIIIETFTPHQLRHTFATNCYHAEMPVEVCRDWMGHSNIKTTLDIYTHLSKTYKRRKKVKLDEFYANQAF